MVYKAVHKIFSPRKEKTQIKGTIECFVGIGKKRKMESKTTIRTIYDFTHTYRKSQRLTHANFTKMLLRTEMSTSIKLFHLFRVKYILHLYDIYEVFTTKHHHIISFLDNATLGNTITTTIAFGFFPLLFVLRVCFAYWWKFMYAMCNGTHEIHIRMDHCECIKIIRMQCNAWLA